MMRALASLTLSIIGNAIGIIVASLVLADFHINIGGVIIAVLFFTAINALLSPFVIKIALKYMPALRGGIALITTLVSLILTAIFTSGLTIGSLSTWIIAPFIIWIATVVAGVLLPMVLFKKVLQDDNKKPTPPSV
jgi:hypothetical protein